MAQSDNSSNIVQTVGWQSDPNNGRGTFSLVSSCLLTLVICVYSAMHLNVPPPRESRLQYWVRTIRWGFWGVFGPELVLFVAWKQYLSAKAVVQRTTRPRSAERGSEQRVVKEKQESMESAEMPSSFPGDPSTPSTIVHGFYAGMGGFAFRLNQPNIAHSRPLFASEHRRLTLTARGVALLADCGLLPNIEKDDICDKSKSDGLSKFIACVQAAWMIVQITGRLIAGLEVTLLEVNTLGHVLCALVIYVLWWHKPRMVQKPIMLEGDWVNSVCAYMFMSSHMSGKTSKTASGTKNNKSRPEMTLVTLFPDVLPIQSTKNVPHDPVVISRQSSGDSILREEALRISSPDPATQPSLMPGRITKGSFRPHLRPSDTIRCSLDLVGRPARLDDISDCDDGQHPHWDLAAEAVGAYPAMRRRFEEVNYTDNVGGIGRCLYEKDPEELLVEYSSNWSTIGLLHGEHGLIMGIILWFASMAFGGIHAAAWHNHFPSEAEAWIWRCSATYISWSGLVWLTINLSAKMYKPIDDIWIGQRLSRAPWVKSWLVAIICALCGSLYLFARVYLVIEAFISIRRLPVGAYQTPDWTQIFPHL